MPFFPRRRRHGLPDSAATPEHAFRARRRFLADAVGIAAGALVLDRTPAGAPTSATASRPTRDPRFTLDRPLTDERVTARYNPFHELGADKESVWQVANDFRATPWTVTLAGLCRTTGTFDIDTLVRRFPPEQRLYRHRCVEAWAMAVPWLGFPLASLVRWAEPRGHATHVRLVSCRRGDARPYYEGLRLDEAMNELTLLATGIYGHALPKQHGAPLRLVVPWKYAYKSIKSVVRIEFTDHEPPTWWNDAAASEYDFLANVDPKVPHPRWSQERERLIGTGGVRDTLRWNGYGEWVAKLYP